MVVSNSAPVLQFQLAIAPMAQSVNVVESPELIGSDSPTPTVLINREQIEVTPGGDRTNSLAVITNHVPGAYLIHDQLHIRGGHQVSWLLDGVPIPNTNIASNVGPQFDPKDIDYLEVQRGSYSAEYGDRTYGVFNVVPRTGFESNREAELVVSYGNFNQTNNQLRFGGHSKRFAYYASLNGNRSDFGLATPTSEVLHDQVSGVGGFASLIYNVTPADQLRIVTGARGDHYQVPNDSEAQVAGIRDVDRERDVFLNFSWARSLNSSWQLTASPFYHFNRADYLGGYLGSEVEGGPIVPRNQRDSRYAGGQVVLSALTRNNNAKVGFYGFYQHDAALFGVRATDGSGLSLQQRERLTGDFQAGFLEDQVKPTSWLTLTGGIRLTRFHGAFSETAASPRAGASIRVPYLNWVLRGFYGRYYQPPPLSTVSGPLLELALSQGFDFLPLHGERNEEHQFGLTLPIQKWMIDIDYFRTGAKHAFDHEALGNSNIFFPLTIEQTRVRGLEVMLRSPRFLGRGQVSLAYSRQRVEGQGAVSGGLTDFSPGGDYFFLDHDQRHTLNVGFNVLLPSHSYAAGNVRYGSGFLDGEGPAHLPGNKTVDFSLGKTFGENWSVAIHSLNVANRRFLLDNSEAFGGTHYADPRQIYVELRYRFHY
jgi:outer membrane receptor for ferrienterochelin and colicin